MKELCIAWQDPKHRSWYTVGRLSFDGSAYKFVYTKGALMSPNFVPFGGMEDLNAVYKSHELFPLFANRLLSQKRPEYKAFLRWLNVQSSEGDPFTLLGRSEGLRGTDFLVVFPRPQRSSDGSYVAHFFCHGLRHLRSCAIQVVNELQPGSRLFLMPDPQNRYDADAVLLRTDDPVEVVGYCPRYLSKDFLYLLKNGAPDTPEVVVEQVNHDAPTQLRLLCCIRAPWPAGFEPCSGEEYEVLA